MFRKGFIALIGLFSTVFIFSSTSLAQETEAATETQVLQIMLPPSAQRILPQSVPAEVTATFDKIISAGKGKLRKGETDVLFWTGSNYKKADANEIIKKLNDSMKIAGWQNEIQGEENGVTVFSAVRETPRHRAVIGIYGITDEAFIFATMEILSADSNETEATSVTGDMAGVQSNSVNNSLDKSSKNLSADNSIVGSWSDGYASLLAGYSPTAGPKTYTPGRSHRFEYSFHSNGTFDFAGIMQVTVYNCTTTYFQDKRGKYAVDGNQLTLTLTKNFWRKQESCSPASNTEQNYKLTPEIFSVSVRRNSRGKDEVCLNKGDGDSCYERAQK